MKLDRGFLDFGTDFLEYLEEENGELAEELKRTPVERR